MVKPMNADNVKPPAPTLPGRAAQFPGADPFPAVTGYHRWQRAWLAATTDGDPLAPIAISFVIPLLKEEDNLRPPLRQTARSKVGGKENLILDVRSGRNQVTCCRSHTTHAGQAPKWVASFCPSDLLLDQGLHDGYQRSMRAVVT